MLPSKSGSILIQSFQFIGSKSHKKKKKKAKDESSQSEPGGSADSKEETDHSEVNSSKKKKKKKKKKEWSNEEDLDESEDLGQVVEPKTETKKAKFDIEKLREALGQTPASSSSTPKSSNVVDGAKNRLKSSQFRFLNEKLYIQNGSQSLKMFSADKVIYFLSASSDCDSGYPSFLYTLLN